MVPHAVNIRSKAFVALTTQDNTLVFQLRTLALHLVDEIFDFQGLRDTEALGVNLVLDSKIYHRTSGTAACEILQPFRVTLL